GQQGLWVTDGTVAGTRELTGIKGAYSGGLAPSDFTIVNKNEMVFSGVNASGNHTLWETNGTAAGTHEISSVLNPGSLATVDPTSTAGTVGVSADAFHFASTLGSVTNASVDMHSDSVVANAQTADLAALMTDSHQGLANTVMAYDGHETTHLDQ